MFQNSCCCTRIHTREFGCKKMNFGKHVVFPKFNLVYYTVAGPRNEFWKDHVFSKIHWPGEKPKASTSANVISTGKNPVLSELADFGAFGFFLGHWIFEKTSFFQNSFLGLATV